MKNPVDFMVERTGLTRAEFTAKHDLGKNLLLRLSQGRLQSVTPRIGGILWGEWQSRGLDQDDFMEEYNTLSVDTAYQRWVHNQRLLNRIRLPRKINAVGGSPFNRFCAEVGSISKTAQVLCVADAVVQGYALGRQREMPDSIREALTDMNYPHTDVLDQKQKEWFDA